VVGGDDVGGVPVQRHSDTRFPSHRCLGVGRYCVVPARRAVERRRRRLPGERVSLVCGLTGLAMPVCCAVLDDPDGCVPVRPVAPSVAGKYGRTVWSLPSMKSIYTGGCISRARLC
jgi:hypothetical protein